VITDDEVMRLFERADPARIDHAASVIDAAGYLDALRTRSIEVKLTQVPPTPTRPPTRHRWPIITAAAAAGMLIVAGALVVATRDDTTEPVSDQAQVATEAPDNPVSANAEAVAAGFIEAFGAFDAEQAITYLADDADISPLLASEGAEDVGGTLEEFRLFVSLLEAQGYQQIVDTGPIVDACEESGGSARATSLRCPFDFHLLRSKEIGLGLFSGSYFDLTIRDGEIVRASIGWGTTEFSPQVWEPFANWVSTAYPEDAAVMYEDSSHSGARLTEQSVQLWERHTGDYAAAASRYIDRAREICSAAHQRVIQEGGPVFYNESWGRILDEALTELRAVPPPEALRAQFDLAYALVEQMADAMMRPGGVGDERQVGEDGSTDFIDALHQVEGTPGMRECTFHGPR
jgi:hypothetical protein